VLSVLRGPEAVGAHEDVVHEAVQADVNQLSGRKLFSAENIVYTTLKKNRFLSWQMCKNNKQTFGQENGNRITRL
jgi:hypothetical protein